MVSWWTCILYTSLIFVCVRVSSEVYLLCFLDICRICSVLGMHNVSSHVVRETVRSESNRPRVLRDQKVLPEVRKRLLLLREFSDFQSSKNWYESNRGSFHFTHSISNIPMTPSWSLRSFRNWRLVCCELHVDTDLEIYGSNIGVCN